MVTVPKDKLGIPEPTAAWKVQEFCIQGGMGMHLLWDDENAEKAMQG